MILVADSSAIGSLGVLLTAKRTGLVAAISPLITEMTKGPIYLSPELIETVLQLAGESVYCLPRK